MIDKELKIGQFDDKEKFLNQIETILKIKGNENADISISHYPFLDENSLRSKINERQVEFKYLILDIYNKDDENIATEILNCIKANQLKIKVLLYSGVTTTMGTINEINYKKSDFSCLLSEKLFVKSNSQELIDYIIQDFLTKNIQPSYSVLNSDDVLLRAEINSIGEKSLSLVIRKIILDKKIESPIIIERMSSGFSGASVFKLHIDNVFHILKISNDKEKLDDEIENAKKYYLKLPSQLRIEINPINYGINGTSAYLIENVSFGITLFEFLKAEKSLDDINSFFSYLFLESYCLKVFYKNNITNTDKYYKINEKFNSDIKKSQIKLTFKELKPLITTISKNEFIDSEIENSLLDYIADNKYKNIRPENISIENNVIICHGDLHSKNIMLRNDDLKAPTLIDTGGMKEDYWCMDVCRLITNLFIEGLNHNKSKYYDIHDLDNQLSLAEGIIDLKPLGLDDVNNGFIHGINWLINNVENVYEGMFVKWEFQLGLLKEFLQISYRKNSVPPNKRTLALLSAYICLKKANSNILNES